MDVLDNEAEEEAPPRPAPPTKQQSHANNTSLHQKTTQNYQNSNNYQSNNFNSTPIYSQKEVPVNNNQAQAASFSAKNILPPKTNEGYHPTSQR